MIAVTSSDFDIEELDEIIAIEILLDSYGIDVTDWNKKQIRHMIKLLNFALQSDKVTDE